MDNIKGLRLLASSLILIGGFAHLALVFLFTEMEIAPNVLFGLLYLVIGIGLFMGKKLFTYLGVCIPLVGAFLGTYSYVFMSSELILLPLIAIDILVVLLCLFLILQKSSST